jgi:signal transduction histidine kinase
MHNSSDYFNHLNGMWIAYSLVAIVCSFTISTLANLLKNNLKRTQELINSQLRLKSLTTLSAGAAHELRTPLNTISLCIDDLKFLLSKDNKKINSQLNTISEQILRCIQIIKDLSLKSGEIEGETYAPVFLRTLISDLIVDFNRDIKIEEFSSVLDNKSYSVFNTKLNRILRKSYYKNKLFFNSKLTNRPSKR